MDGLHLHRIKADRAGLGALGANAVAKRLLGVLGQQLLERKRDFLRTMTPALLTDGLRIEGGI
ncbi:hypothetical protein IVA93_23055 [Bradyrhizobium sp. 155]|nr:hypothetical protein IVA93_23055 [Bradyrhizobium sp. 155]